MKFFASYRSVFKFIIVCTAIGVVGFCAYSWTLYDNGIVDYDDSRDKQAVKKMFHDDWQWLQFGDWDKITEDDYDVDFMLDHRSRSQHMVDSKLVLKVYRDHGQTVGFLAYHPESLYSWRMLFLIVDKDARGKGCASKLIQYFIDDSIARGALKLITFTRVLNSRARSLYEGKFGFKATPCSYDDKYLDLVLYPNKRK